MELRHLRYFTAVAEELHFGHAAAKLHIAQPPLSQQIRKLEAELGVTLFERTRRRVRLTPAGAVFLDEARRTLAQAAQAARAAQRANQGEVGRLAIGFVDSAVYYVLPSMLRAFRARFPQVELALHELGPVAQAEMLADGRLDVGFFRSSTGDPRLEQRAIFAEPLIAAVPRSHRLAGSGRILLRALWRDPFVIFPRSLGPGFYDHIVSLCRAESFSPRVVQEANEMQTVVSLVAAGIGVAVVPASVQNLRIPGVAYLGIKKPVARTSMFLAMRRNDSSPVLGGFLRVLRELVRRPPRDLPR